MKKLLQFLVLCICTIMSFNSLNTHAANTISQKNKNVIDTVLDKKIFATYSDTKLEKLKVRLSKVDLKKFKKSPKTYLLLEYLIFSFNTKYASKFDIKKTEALGIKQDKQVAELLKAVNKVRKENGKNEVVISEKLTQIAEEHLKNMLENNFYSHNLPNGTTFAQRMQKSGYKGAASGENLARGTDSVEKVMGAWMKSEGHKKNMLSEKFTEIGIAYKDDYWIQIFGAGEK